ncbi:MAG: hypothetical protein ACF8R7_03040 [Phycisphaerales bacterium JB039]
MLMRSNHWVAWVGLLLAQALGGCAAPPSIVPRTGQVIGPGRVPVEAIGTMLISAADEHVVRLQEAGDTAIAQAPSTELRARLNRASLLNAHATYKIVIGPNPMTGLLDLLVMTSLQTEAIRRAAIDPTLTEAQRQAPESYAVDDAQLQALLTEDQRTFLIAFEDSQRNVRAVAAQVFWPEQLEVVDGLIEEWWLRNPARRFVSHVRLQDFASYRAASVGAGSGRSGSIFTLLRLDPLASLDPTTRELAETRMLAERVMFQIQRAPNLLSMYAKDLLYETVSIEEIEALQAEFAATRIALLDIVEIAERLPADIQTERTAAIEQVEAWIATERDAAITQVAESVATERSAAIEQLEQWIAGERQTSIEQIAAAVAAEREATLEQLAMWLDVERSTTITEVEDAIVRRTADLRTAASSAPEPLDITVKRLIDYLFWRCAQLVGVILAGAVIAALLVRLIGQRLTRRGRAVAA